jgi:hypothetical protein
MPIRGCPDPCDFDRRRRSDGRAQRLLGSAAAAAVAGLFLPAPAPAADITSTWKTYANDNWNAPVNWSNAPAVNAFPNNGNLGHTYDAVFNGGAATLNVSPTLRNLSVNDGLIRASGGNRIDVTGTFTFASGYVGVPVTVAAGGSFVIAGGDAPRNLADAVTIGGTFGFSGTATAVSLMAVNPSARVHLLPTARFALDRTLNLLAPPPDPFNPYPPPSPREIRNASLFAPAAGARIDGSSGWRFVNTGTLRVTAPFDLSTETFRNSGLIDLPTAGAVLNLTFARYAPYDRPDDLSGNLGGAINVASGATLTLQSPGSTFLAVSNVSVTNAGTLNLRGNVVLDAPGLTLPGVVNVATGTSVSAVVSGLHVYRPAEFTGPVGVDASRISGSARLTVRDLTFRGSILDNAELYVRPGGTMTVPAASGPLAINRGRLTVDGTLDWFAATSLRATTEFVGTHRAVVRILAGAAFRVRPSAAATLDGLSDVSHAPDRLDNAGLIDVDRSSFTVGGRGWHFDNTGTVRVTAGALAVSARAFTNAGSIDLLPGSTATFAPPTGTFNNLRTDVTPAGLLNVRASAAATFAGDARHRLANAGTIDVAGQLSSRWYVSNAGTIRATGPAATIKLGSPGPTGTVIGDNSGSVLARDGATISITGDWTNPGSLDALDGGKVTLVGTWTHSGSAAAANGGMIAGGGAITPTGAVVAHAGGTVRFTGATTNRGAVTVQSGGRLEIVTTVSNPGSIQVQTGGTLARSTDAQFARLDLPAGGSLTIGPGATASVGNGTASGSLTNSGLVDLRGSTLALGRNWSVENRALIHLTDRALLRVAGLYNDPAGAIDLSSGAAAIFDAGPTPQLTNTRTRIRAGYDGGAWSGPGIRSASAQTDPATAVGYAEARFLSATPFEWMGQPVSGQSVLVRHTLYGDATLDGTVDFADLVKVAQNYESAASDRHWFHGDFTYDGKVDFADLVKLAQNYDAAMPAGVPGATDAFTADLAAAMAAVPEPACAVAGVAAWGLWSSRRRAGRDR